MEIQGLKHELIATLARSDDIGVKRFQGAYVSYKNYSMVNPIEGGTTLFFYTFAKSS